MKQFKMSMYASKEHLLEAKCKYLEEQNKKLKDAYENIGNVAAYLHLESEKLGELLEGE